MHDSLNATLITREDIAERHTIFAVHLDLDIPHSFIPGQWTELGLPRSDDPDTGPTSMDFVQDGIVRRAYSIASPPDEEHLEFFFNYVEEGGLTPWLWRLKPGERLYVNPEARGGFTLEGLPPHLNVIAIATGTGVAPFASMLRGPEKASNWKSFTLIHGARFEKQLGFRDEFEALEGTLDGFHYIPTITQPDASWNGKIGRVQQRLLDDSLLQIAGLELDPCTSRVFLCGNSDMIHTVEDVLMKRGFRPRWEDADGTIHTEIYY